MVGPWQVPVADVAVSLSDFDGYAGEAMAMGERAPVALLDAPASGRLAVGEAITNIIAADVRSLADIRLSANWMAACGRAGRGCRPVCHRRGGGRRSLRQARHHHSGGQGFAFHAHGVDRRARQALGRRAGLAGHLRVRADCGRPAHAHARARSLPSLAAAAHRSRSAGKTASADRAGRRCSSDAGGRRPISTTRSSCVRCSRRCASSKIAN